MTTNLDHPYRDMNILDMLGRLIIQKSYLLLSTVRQEIRRHKITPYPARRRLEHEKPIDRQVTVAIVL